MAWNKEELKYLLEFKSFVPPEYLRVCQSNKRKANTGPMLKLRMRARLRRDLHEEVEF